LYPALERRFRLSALRKIALGMFVTAAAFAIPAWLQIRIDAGAAPSIAWQLLAYLGLTAGEVMVSVTCLEFSYTQAPHRMKSFVMAFFMLSVALGNLFTSAVNFLIQEPDGAVRLAGADYYWFFTLLMLGAAALFLLVVRFYRERTYLHAELPATAESPDPHG
jgi:POT family proton-dependent oligopeptide transporter